MNVRLTYDMAFTAGIWYDSKFMVNNYDLTLRLLTNTGESVEQNIALARVKYFVYDIIQHSVFVNASHADQRKKLSAAGIRCTTLPEEPVDQIVGMALFLKLNSIMQDRMMLVELDISSDLGDNVVYCHSIQEPLGPLSDSGWWTESSPSHCDHATVNRNQRVIAINPVLKWRDVDLDWPQDDTPPDNDIVITSFKREDK